MTSVDPYILGLWCADGYWWSSSIGLSNVEPELILRFGSYLADQLGPDRLRVRVYAVPGSDPDRRVIALTEKRSHRPASKMKRTAYHVYVNSRPLLREFCNARRHLGSLTASAIGPYIAGRFDGDGSWGTTPRIAYRNASQAELDRRLLNRAGIGDTSLLEYRAASEYCIYVRKKQWSELRDLLSEYSWKLNNGW